MERAKYRWEFRRGCPHPTTGTASLMGHAASSSEIWLPQYHLLVRLLWICGTKNKPETTKTFLRVIATRIVQQMRRLELWTIQITSWTRSKYEM